jgi:hypothetical protein
MTIIAFSLLQHLHHLHKSREYRRLQGIIKGVETLAGVHPYHLCQLPAKNLIFFLQCSARLQPPGRDLLCTYPHSLKAPSNGLLTQAEAPATAPPHQARRFFPPSSSAPPACCGSFPPPRQAEHERPSQNLFSRLKLQ